MTDDAIVAATLQHGGIIEYAAIARAVGINYRTAKTYVERLRPRIDEALKAKEVTTTQSVVTPAPPAAVPTRAEREEKLTRDLLNHARFQVSTYEELAETTMKIVARAKEAAANLQALDAPKALALLSAISKLALRNQQIAELALRLERLRVGQPTETIGIELSNLSVQDAIREGEAMIKALRTAQEQGLLDDESAEKKQQMKDDGATALPPSAQHASGAPGDPGAPAEWRSGGPAVPTCCSIEMTPHGAHPDPEMRTYACLRCGARKRTTDGRNFFELNVVAQLQLQPAS
jgi:hypothetical protein